MITGGVCGVRSNADCVQQLFDQIFRLQHRGQEYAGMGTWNSQRDKREILKLRTHRGLVAPSFTDDLAGLEGMVGIGHTSSKGRQPDLKHYKAGQIIACTDSYIENASDLFQEMFSRGHSFSTLEDVDLLTSVIGEEDNVEEGLRKALSRIQGPCSIVLLTDEGVIYAARDPLGYKPLVLGQNESDIAVASESCSFSFNMAIVRDVEPGEIVRLDSNGFSTIARIGDDRRKICCFEWFYYARPDSIIDTIPVAAARHRAGGILAQYDSVSADVIGAVPFSGLLHAEGYHLVSGLPSVITFLMPQYIQRTYIKPLATRKLEKSRKLNVLQENVKGKRVIVVDDSIRSAITIQGLVDYLFQAGAEEVHIRIGSPASIRYCPHERPPLKEEDFIASTHSVEEIRQFIGATTLMFLPLDEVSNVCGLPADWLCIDCFLRG